MDGDGADDDGPERRPPEQLPWSCRSSQVRGGDFLPAPSNEAALAMIDQWPNWRPHVAAARPPGSGKSHLARFGPPEPGHGAAPRELPSLEQLSIQAPTALLIDGLDRVRTRRRCSSAELRA